MDPRSDRTADEILGWLRHLIVMGRRYEAFSREHPSEAALRIAEINAPGLEEDAWDLRWIPPMLQARIARVASIVVLHLCRSPEDPEHDPTLMDMLMPSAIVAACVVAHAYGNRLDIPPSPLPGRLARWAEVLSASLEPSKPLEATTYTGMPALRTTESPIVRCLPMRVRSRLIVLARLMSHEAFSMNSMIATVIFFIGAVATDAFEALDLSDPAADEEP